MVHEGMSEHQRASLPSDAFFSLYLLLDLEEGGITRRCFSTSTIAIMQAESMHPEEAEGDRLLVLDPLSCSRAGRRTSFTPFDKGNQDVCKLLLCVVFTYSHLPAQVRMIDSRCREVSVCGKCDLILPCGNIWLNQVKLYIQLYRLSASAFKPSPLRFTCTCSSLLLCVFTRHLSCVSLSALCLHETLYSCKLVGCLYFLNVRLFTHR